jgi:DNA polymerase III delta prime subunit
MNSNKFSLHKIEVIPNPIRESVVYDFQVEDNENFFVGIDNGNSLLVHNCLLMPLEAPHPRMTWILSSMSPEKFNSTQNGKAILSRSAQFHLQGYSDAELSKQAMRIIKGEEMSFMSRELRDLVVAECNGEMRTLANLLEGLASYHSGMQEPPSKLPLEAAQEVLRVSVGDDDKVAVRLLTSIYAGKMKNVLLELLNITDAFSVISKMIYANSAVLNDLALNGQRHQKVWMTVAAKALKDNLQGEKIKKYSIDSITSMQVALIDLKAQAQIFAVPEDQAILRFAAKFIQENAA